MWGDDNWMVADTEKRGLRCLGNTKLVQVIEIENCKIFVASNDCESNRECLLFTVYDTVSRTKSFTSNQNSTRIN